MHLKLQLSHLNKTQTTAVALVLLLNDSRADLQQAPEQATALATDPLGPLPDGMDPLEAAAMTVVCNVLLNLDEIFLKR